MADIEKWQAPPEVEHVPDEDVSIIEKDPSTGITHEVTEVARFGGIAIKKHSYRIPTEIADTLFPGLSDELNRSRNQAVARQELQQGTSSEVGED